MTLQDLASADECFLSGTGAELVPVRQIGEHILEQPDNALTPMLMLGFRERIEQYCSRPCYDDC